MGFSVCIKCKQLPSYFEHRDFVYCKDCFLEQVKHKVRVAINAKPKIYFPDASCSEAHSSTIALYLSNSAESLALLKYVVYHEYAINTKYRNLSYLFILYSSSNPQSNNSYMDDIKTLLSDYEDVFEFEDDKNDPFMVKSILMSIDKIYSGKSITVYLPNTQYDTAFFTLLLTLKGQGKFIPAFSSSSFVLPSKKSISTTICRPLFHVSKEEIDAFNSLSLFYALSQLEDNEQLAEDNKSQQSNANDSQSTESLLLENLYISNSVLNTSFCGDSGSGCHSSSGGGCSKSFDDSSPASEFTGRHIPSSTSRPDLLFVLLNNFISELQKDSNHATVSILARTAQKLDSSFITTETRCAECPIPDLSQTVLCDRCSI